MGPVLPAGYKISATHCGIKQYSQDEDLCLISSEVPAVAAGVYTTNKIVAAPVVWDRAITPSADVRIILVNSGNANACTGERGDRDTAEMARMAAETVNASARQALVLSTGIIGEFLPMDRIQAGIAAAAATYGTDTAQLAAAARGFMTTDTRPKLASRRLGSEAGAPSLTGIAKGAGMIGPKMATMLSVLITDARLDQHEAQTLLSEVVEQTFNCISVEGHMSTNDTVLLLANGMAEGPHPDRETLRNALLEVCEELARAIPDDGEGASHLITIDVTGCSSRADARQIAKSVAESALVKTAVTGADPNWGRIVSAVGYAEIPFDPQNLRLILNDALLYEQGSPVQFDAAAVSASMRSQREVRIRIELAEGTASCRFWTSDLTEQYIKINAEYHT